MLNGLFSLGISDSELAVYAAKIGADCPFFIYNRPLVARGIGDEFSDAEVDLTGKTMVLIKPDVSVSTAEAYGGVTPRVPESDVADIVRLPLEEWKGVLVNDFEAHVFRLHPRLAGLKESFYRCGAVYASMSGSGSAIYGIFDSDNMADRFVANCSEKKLYKLKL